MNEPEGAQNVLGHRVGEAGKRPGLPAPPLPSNSLEAGLQMGLSGLTSRILLLQLDKLPSNLLNQNKEHTQTHNAIKYTNKSRNNNNTKLSKIKQYTRLARA